MKSRESCIYPPQREINLKISVVVCAYNEERYLPACLHSLLAQTRPPDELVVVNNASTDRTADVARRVSDVRVVDEPRRGLVWARAAGGLATTGDVIAYIDADCRAPLFWLERIERRFIRSPRVAALTGTYRYYDWDLIGRLLIRMYDFSLGPLTHVLAQDVLRIGALLYGGNFAIRRTVLEQIGGFDTSIEFHGEDTNLGRRVARVGRVQIARPCYVFTSARRYRAMGRGPVFRLYVRNCWSELVHHRPADRVHSDVRG